MVKQKILYSVLNFFYWKMVKETSLSEKEIANNRTSILGPSFCCKKYFTLRKLKNNVNRDFFDIIRSPQQ